MTLSTIIRSYTDTYNGNIAYLEKVTDLQAYKNGPLETAYRTVIMNDQYFIHHISVFETEQAAVNDIMQCGIDWKEGKTS